MALHPVVRSTLIGLALLGHSRPAAAQDGEPRVLWTVGNPKVGFCIHFLMSPDAAADNLVRGQRLVIARESSGLPDAVRRVVSDQPEFEGWVPSQLCVIYPEAIWVNKKRFDRGDGGARIALAIWGVSSAGDGASFSIRTLASNSSALKWAMEAELIPVQRVDLKLQAVSESKDEQYVLRLEDAVVTLEGLAKTDSIDVENVPFPSKAALRGLNNTVWLVTLGLKPTRIGTLPGALRVEGKRGLGNALIKSPIRYVGNVIAGGTGEISFTR